MTVQHPYIGIHLSILLSLPPPAPPKLPSPPPQYLYLCHDHLHQLCVQLSTLHLEPPARLHLQYVLLYRRLMGALLQVKVALGGG